MVCIYCNLIPTGHSSYLLNRKSPSRPLFEKFVSMSFFFFFFFPTIQRRHPAGRYFLPVLPLSVPTAISFYTTTPRVVLSLSLCFCLSFFLVLLIKTHCSPPPRHSGFSVCACVPIGVQYLYTLRVAFNNYLSLLYCPPLSFPHPVVSCVEVFFFFYYFSENYL